MIKYRKPNDKKRRDINVRKALEVLAGLLLLPVVLAALGIYLALCAVASFLFSFFLWFLFGYLVFMVQSDTGGGISHALLTNHPAMLVFYVFWGIIFVIFVVGGFEELRKQN